MKKEAGKKNKKWLWLVLVVVALLAAAGTVLALVLPGGSGQEAPEAVSAELYWNVDRLTYTQDAEMMGISTREAAQDGNFYVRFAYEGQQLELQVIDKQLVNYIDSMDVMGLVFDADGVVIDAVAPETFVTKAAGDFYVREVKEGSAVLNSSIAMNGMEIEIAITEETAVYDVAPDAEMVGQPGTLQIFDRVIAFANEEGTVTHVYVTAHPVDAEIYWRVERCLDTETGLSTREPDENGVYTIAFAHDGQLVDLKCKDVEVVNAIDLNGILAGQFALVFDEEGYIVDSIDVGMALRGTLFASDYHVTGLEGDTVSLTKLSAGTEQGSTKSFTISQDCQIWQCCQFGCYDHNCGEIMDSLQMYDRVNVYTNLDGEAIMIFVTRRMVDTPMFYNLEQKYGGEAVGSTREKQGGYYVFEMLSEGKVLTLKTADKAIADAIDSRSNRCSGLVLDGNIITRVYDPACVSGGTALGNRSPLSSMSGSVITVSDPYSGGSWNAVLSADCKIYNVITGVYGKAPGGEMDLQVGDIVTTFRNYKEEICMVFVASRPVQGAKIYYNLERQYDAQLKQTKREPDANGYYTFLMACEGKQVTVKTQSKGLATFIDSQNAPLVGLKVDKSGIVTNAYEVTIAKQNITKTCNYHYVKNLNQKAGTFSTYYLENGQKKDSSVAYQQMAKDCVVYNVSYAYENYRGEASKLKDGDQIQAIMDVVTGEIVQIYIMNRDPIFGFKSYNAPCAHCGKTVTWEPYGGSVIVEADTHYYACSDYLLRQGIIGSEKDDKVYDVVIDLKGKTVKGSGRAFLVYDKLTILDSVGGGKVAGLTPSGGTATSGSTVMVLNGGELNIMGGELTLSEKSTVFGSSGGVLFVGEKSVVNMSGGKITGGISTDRGGNVYNGGTFNMTGGSITGGSATVGANIVSIAGSALNISGGTVDGGIQALGNAKVTLSGKPVIGADGLKLPAGATISVAGLTKGASVVVDGDGIFTEELTDAASYLSYFKPASKEDRIETAGNALNYIKKRVNYNGVNNGNLAFAAGSTNAVCPVCEKSVAWTALSANATTLAGGNHYYLTADVTYTGSEAAYITGPASGTACVHLNGHNITATAYSAVEGKSGTLNIMGNGTVTGSYNEHRLFGATVTMNGADGTLNLIGGTYTKSQACNVSSVVLIRGGDLNMYSGAQVLGVKDSGKCANVVVFDRSFNMYGGKLSGGAGQQLQSNNWSPTATAITNIHGGEIQGTVAITGAQTKRGTFCMDGGTITGFVNLSRFVNSLITGGKVDGTVNIDAVATNENSSVTVSGNPVITGSGLVIPEGYKLTVGQLVSGASIRVYANGIFTGKLADAQAAAAYFAARGSSDEILVVDNALAYNLVPRDVNDINNDPLSFTTGTNAVCPVCDSGEVTWTALSADTTTLESGKHYYLTANVTYTGSEAPYITGPDAGMACVHLNGYNITATAHRAIEGKAGMLNIMGTGTVSGSYNADRLNGATVNMNGANGSLNLFGGTYTKSESCNISPVLLIRNGDVNLCATAHILGANDSGNCANVVVFNRSFNMFGGKISGGAGQQLQANNWSPTATAATSIYGGEILGTVAISGAQTKRGTFYMEGGTITGYVNLSRFVDSVITGGTVNGTLNIDTRATNENSAVLISGTPVITGSGLIVPEGYKISVGELVSGAGIQVYASGVFTDVLSDAEATREFFTPVGADDKIEANDNALAYIKVPKDLNAVDNGPLSFTTGTNAVCPACGGREVTWTALSANATTLEGGKHYYLTDDVTYTGSTVAYITGPATGTACVHLNGCDITATAYSAFEGKSGTLNIMGSGTVTGSYNANRLFGATLNMNGAEGSLNLIGGTYTKSQACNVSSVVLIRSGDVNMYNGAQVLGVNDSGSCANVVVFNRSFNMYGGKLSGGAGQQLQANNWSPTATAITNIYGGEIVGTVAISGADTKHGTFNMTGGKIEGYVNLNRFVDTVITGGTVDGTVNIDTPATNENSSVTLSDAPVITGTGLVIPAGYKISVGELAATASIRVTATGVFTDVLADAEGVKERFVPADGYEIIPQENALVCRKLPVPDAPAGENALVLKGKQITAAANAMTFPTNRTQSSQECPVCEKVVTWKPLSAQLGAVNDGQHHHYYLTGTVNSQYQFITLTSGTVCLHMNGNNVNLESRTFITGGDLNIMGTGAIIGLGTSGTQSGTLTVGDNATASLYGCTVTSVAQSGTPAIRLVNGSAANVHVYDGAVIGGEEGSCHGANVVIEKGAFRMYGGTIQNGAGYLEQGVRRGGNVFISAGTTFEMYAGTVTGGTATQGGNIHSAGGSLSVHTGASITGGVTTGTDAHGGNISMITGSSMEIDGGEISGGTAAGQGGNIRAWNTAITMTDGEIFGGDSLAGANDNVWVAGSSVMTMLGGTVKGTDGATLAGTAINLSQTGVLYLGGDAQVIRDDGNNVGNIYVYASATETAALKVLSDWTGTAGVKWTKAYATGDTVDADRGSCGTLEEGVFTKGGSYTGTLVYEQGQSCVVGDAGTLKLAAAE